MCDMECVDLQTSDTHCGRCSQRCGGGSCVAGSCVCADSAQTLCGSACVDLNTSSTSCGSCGNVCVSPESCFDGECRCPEGERACGDECRNIRGSDIANCGGCDRTCGADAFCDEGRCRCPEGFALCSEDCHDTSRDPFHCGRCGTQCDARAGQVCAAAACHPRAVWALGYPSNERALTDSLRNVSAAVDPVTNHIYVAYSTLLSGGGTEVTLVALDEDGAERWTNELSVASGTAPTALAVGGGQVMMALSGAVTRSNVRVFDAEDGALIEAHLLGSDTTSVAADSEGGFIVVGVYTGGFALGSVVLPSVSWHTVFVVRFGPDARADFGFPLGHPSVSEQHPAVALASDGTFFVAAAGGGRSFTKDGVTFPGQGWVAGFDSAGTALWADGASLQAALDLAVSPSHVMLYSNADGFVHGVDVGTETFTATWSHVGERGFLLPLYPFRPDGGGAAYASQFFVSSPGRDDYSLGGLRATGSRARDSLVAAIEADGAVDWLSHLSVSADSSPEDVGATSDFVVLVGRYEGVVQVDEVALGSMGEDAVYVVRIDR